MPTAADRLAQQHQRDIATIAGGVTSVVASVALGADPAAIGTWYWGVVDGLINRVQVGYAQSRRSAMGYLPRHAALSDAGSLELAPGSLDVGRLRERLRIVGPVGFKSSIAAGADTDQALRSMATRMAGVADESVRDGDRDVVEQTALRGRGVVGWRRRLSGRACGFCSMLASRGAVYVNKQSATVSSRGTRYHEHCHCWAEPLYKREEEPASVRLLRRQWDRVTAGHSGKDAQRVWRRHWEQRVTPRARQRFGLAAAEPSGGRAVPGVAVQVRQVLADAQSPEAVSRALAAEYSRITGRTMTADLRGSVATAREHAEGVLRAVERNPEIVVATVRTGRTTKRSSYAEARPRQQEIIFSEDWSTVARRQDYLGAIAVDARTNWHPAGTGSPTGIAIHEMGHLLDMDTLGESIRLDLDDLLAERVALTARSVDVEDIDEAIRRLIEDEVSRYAAKDLHELVAEAFSAVLANGAAAPRLSREIVALLDDAHQAGFRGSGTTAALPSATDLSRLPVTRLRAMVAQHGITVPTGLRKPALVRLVDDLDSGVAASTARQRAVASIVDERRGVADALTRALEVADGSDRALRHVATSLRRELSADQLKTLKPLLDALDAADGARVRTAVETVARSAKLRQIGAPGAVQRIPAGQVEWIGPERSAVVSVVRPGWETTVERRTVLLQRAAAQAATPEQAAALAPVKAAKKAAKAAPAPDLTGERGLSTVPEIREVQIDNRVRQVVDRLRADPFGRVPRYINIDLRAGGDWVSIPEIRMVLPDIDEAEINAALRRLNRQPGNTTATEFEEISLPREFRGRALRLGGQDKYWFSMADTSLRPLPATAAPAKAAKKAAKAAPAKKATKSTGQPVFRQLLSDVAPRRTEVAPSVLGLDGTYGGLDLRISRVTVDRVDGARFDGAIVDPATGVEVGRLSYKVGRDRDGALYAHHEMIELAPSSQGSGFATELGDRLVEVYRASGVRYINLGASDVGSYTWAVRGFDFRDAGALTEFLDRMPDLTVDEMRRIAPSLTARELDAQLAELRVLVARARAGERVTAREFSQVGRRAGQGRDDVWLGKAVMLNNHWRGRMDLSSAAPAKKASPRKAPAPPAPARMSIAALKTEIGRTADLDVADLPKPALAKHVTDLRSGTPAAQVRARIRQDVIDQRRAVAESLAEVAELLVDVDDMSVVAFRLDARLRRILPTLGDGSAKTTLTALQRAVRAGNPAAIRRAIVAAERKAGLKRVDVSTMDRTAMSPTGGSIRDGAQVEVVRPGYTVELGGERVVLSKAVVREVREAPSIGDMIDATPTREQLDRMDAAARQAVTDGLKRDVGLVLDGQIGRLRVAVARVEVTDRGLKITADVLDKDGNEVGQIWRTVERRGGKLVATHELIDIDRKFQGSGFAQEVNEKLYAWYRRSGVSEVRLTANIDVGGFAWARKGFDFQSADEAQAYLARAAEKIEKALRRRTPPRGLTREQLTELQRYVEDLRAGRAPVHAPDIAVFGRKPGQAGKTAVWPGKWLMLGHDSYWHGVLYL